MTEQQEQELIEKIKELIDPLYETETGRDRIAELVTFLDTNLA